MKKIIFILLLSLMFLVGCSNTETKVKVLLPSGTPLLSVGNLLDDENFEFTIVNGQDPLIAAFSAGEYDMIIAPLNLGAKLYLAGTSTYKLSSIITTNNTYLISKKEITSITDVSGKKIMGYGNGSTPALALNAALQMNSITSEVTYQNSASDVSTLFMSDSNEADYYLSAEPNITTMREKKGMDVYTLDLSEVLKGELDVLIQACLFVNPNSKISDSVFEKIEENIKEMNKNPESYASKVLNKNGFFTTLGENVIAKAIPNSNITYLKASENKTPVEKYYAFLNKYNSKILGGKTPDETFYY